MFSGVTQILHRLGLQLLYCAIRIKAFDQGKTANEASPGQNVSGLSYWLSGTLFAVYKHNIFSMQTPPTPPPPLQINFKVTQFQTCEFFKNKLNIFSQARPMSLSGNESAVIWGDGRVLMGDNASGGAAVLPPIEFQCFGCEFQTDCLILKYITNHKYNQF